MSLIHDKIMISYGFINLNVIARYYLLKPFFFGVAGGEQSWKFWLLHKTHLLGDAHNKAMVVEGVMILEGF